jgi:hypothetical protein
MYNIREYICQICKSHPIPLLPFTQPTFFHNDPQQQQGIKIWKEKGGNFYIFIKNIWHPINKRDPIIM